MAPTTTPALPFAPYVPPPAIPDPTPNPTLQKYVGIFRSTAPAPAAEKTITIACDRKNLFITYPLDLFAPVNTTTPTPTSAILTISTKTVSATTKTALAPTTKTSTLFLACNGVPQVRVSGDTPEEAEMNAELQAMGLVHLEGKMVGFDVGGDDGVRVGRELLARAAEEKETVKGKEKAVVEKKGKGKGVAKVGAEGKEKEGVKKVVKGKVEKKK